MATIVRETYRNNMHYFLVMAGKQPLGVYSDDGDHMWDPKADRYLGPANREPEFKGSSEEALIKNSTFIKTSIQHRDVVQHVLNALKVAIKIAAEDGAITWVGQGKQRYPTAAFMDIQVRAQRYFDKNVKLYRNLVYSFSKSEEAQACRDAIAALTTKKANKYVIAAVQERLESLDVNERIKREDRPIVR